MINRVRHRSWNNSFRTRYKKGVTGNPKGRRKRGALKLGHIVKGALNARTQMRIKGRVRTVTRLEAMIRVCMAKALAGDVTSAKNLLEIYAHAKKQRDLGPIIITIEGGLPDDV
jgi:hypothetical protein